MSLEIDKEKGVSHGSTHTPLDELHQGIDLVGEALMDTKLNKELQVLMMARIQLSETWDEIVTSQTVDDQPVDEGTMARLTGLLDRKQELSAQVIRLKQDAGEMQNQLDDIKAANLKYLVANREVMKAVSSSQKRDTVSWEKFAYDPAIVEANKKLERVKACLSIYRNAFQGIILASELDWARNDDLRATMIDLGVPLGQRLQSLN